MVMYWSITPMRSIKESGSEITFFCSVQGWLSQAVQWNTTQSHLQLSKLSKKTAKSQKTFLFLSTPASDLTCIHYAKPVKLEFSDSICDLLHVLEALTDCTGRNTSCKFSAHMKRSSKSLKFGVKNNRAPKTRTQQGLPFTGYKYWWLSRRHSGTAQRSVQQCGILKTCAQLTDWQQPSEITTAPGWREHSIIPASHTWENKNIIEWELLLSQHRSCSFRGWNEERTQNLYMAEKKAESHTENIVRKYKMS